MNTLSASNLRGTVAATLPALHGTSVGDFLQGISGDRPQVAFELDQHLRDVVKSMLAWRVHRAWLVDDHGRPIGVVSYTDVIRTIYQAERPEPELAD